MKNVFIFIALCIALAFSSCVQTEPNVWGSISGVIKDAQSNRALEGVKVTVTSTGASKITNSDGQFSFDNLEAVEYTLSFEKTGYITNTQTVRVQAGEQMTVQVQMKQNRLGLEVSPTLLDFGATTGALDLTIRATGGQTVHYEAAASHSWIILQDESGTVSNTATMRVMVSRAAAPGKYDGFITLSANSESLNVPVYMQIAGGTVPVLTIESVTSITQTTAGISGLLALESGISVTDYGVCYSASGNTPTVNDSKVSRGGASASTSFTCQLSGLTAATEYHVRTYAKYDGETYYSDTQTFTTAGSGGGGGSGTEDYSSASASSDNPNITVTIRSCHRAGVRVTMEALLENTGVNAYDNYYIYQNNSGYKIGDVIYASHVKDDLYSSYEDYAVTKYLNTKSSIYGLTTSLPIHSPQILKATIDGVPTDATWISLYLATEFRDANPKVQAYLAMEKVPIY